MTTATMQMSAALHFAGQVGVPVFPCGPDKRPLTAHGFKDATRDPDQVRDWWVQHPDALVGMPTGEPSNTLVIDLDVEPEPGGSVRLVGEDSLRALEAELGPLPATRTVRTPSGGKHLYFLHVPGVSNSVKRLGPGIDVRTAGGYVIAAGPGYEVEIDGGPVASPAPWGERLRGPSVAAWSATGAAVPTSWHSLTPEEQERHRAYLASAAEGELARLDTLVRPWRDGAGWDDTCHQVAANLHEIGNAGHPGLLESLRAEYLRRAPRDAVWHDGPERKWESGHATAAGKVRVVPPATRGFLVAPSPAAGSAVEQDVRDVLQVEDAELAEQVAERALRGKFLHATGYGWLEWDGRRWAPVNEKVVREAVRLFIQAYNFELGLRINERLAGETDKEIRKHLFDQFNDLKRLSDLRKQNNVMKFAEGIVSADASDFDQQPYLLNVGNGVVDLRTGDLLAHDPALLLTKVTDVPYVVGHRHPDWTQALEALRPEPRSLLQLRMGQAATGNPPPDDVVLFLEGGGENGKSTVMQTLTKAFGRHAVYVSDKALLATSDAHSTELMDFQGARLALVEELPEQRLNATQLKKLTTENITARRMRQDPVTFRTTHSLVVTTNYRPIVTETDRGTWRRLVLLRFTFTFKKPSEALRGPNDRHGQPGLRERMLVDPGVLQAAIAWVIEGAVAFHRLPGGFVETPREVAEDTRAWRRDSDVLLSYLQDQLVPDPAGHVSSPDLYATFCEHLRATGQQAWSEKTFHGRLATHAAVSEHGIDRVRPKAAPALSRPRTLALPSLPARPWLYRGLRFLSPDEAPQAGWS